MDRSLSIAIQAAFRAGAEILEVYESPFAVETKEDNSPLTEADRRAHAVIQETLSATGIPLLSEEGRAIPYEERRGWKQCWLVDPLDGTKEFIKRNGEFTVNIALLEEGLPVLGVIYVPVKRELYWGSPEGSYKLEEAEPEAFRAARPVLPLQAERLPVLNGKRVYTVVASRSHLSPETEALIGKKRLEHGELEITSMGSSLKICLVAEGRADVYPRLAPTMEWDTAAGHAIARYAGCQVLDPDTGQELHYNKENLLNPWFIVERTPSF